MEPTQPATQSCPPKSPAAPRQLKISIPVNQLKTSQVKIIPINLQLQPSPIGQFKTTSVRRTPKIVQVSQLKEFPITRPNLLLHNQTKTRIILGSKLQHHLNPTITSVTFPKPTLNKQTFSSSLIDSNRHASSHTLLFQKDGTKSSFPPIQPSGIFATKRAPNKERAPDCEPIVCTAANTNTNTEIHTKFDFLCDRCGTPFEAEESLKLHLQTHNVSRREAEEKPVSGTVSEEGLTHNGTEMIHIPKSENKTHDCSEDCSCKYLSHSSAMQTNECKQTHSAATTSNKQKAESHVSEQIIKRLKVLLSRDRSQSPVGVSACTEGVPPEQQERNPSLDRDVPAPLQIKEEQEELLAYKLWLEQTGTNDVINTHNRSRIYYFPDQTLFSHPPKNLTVENKVIDPLLCNSTKQTNSPSPLQLKPSLQLTIPHVAAGQIQCSPAHALKESTSNQLHSFPLSQFKPVPVREHQIIRLNRIKTYRIQIIPAAQFQNQQNPIVSSVPSSALRTIEQLSTTPQSGEQSNCASVGASAGQIKMECEEVGWIKTDPVEVSDEKEQVKTEQDYGAMQPIGAHPTVPLPCLPCHSATFQVSVCEAAALAGQRTPGNEWEVSDQKNQMRKEICSSHLRWHMKTHTEKPYSCSVCGKRYRYKEWLRIHVRQHVVFKPFKCNKEFSKIAMMRHCRTHTSKRLYSRCWLCSKWFSHKIYLRSHMRSHFLNKPFKCPVCGKGYKCKIPLIGHLIAHSKEKPYRCAISTSTHLVKTEVDKEASGPDAVEIAGVAQRESVQIRLIKMEEEDYGVSIKQEPKYQNRRQERSYGVGQEDPEPPEMREDQEQLWNIQQGLKLEEANLTTTHDKNLGQTRLMDESDGDDWALSDYLSSHSSAAESEDL